MLVKSFLHVLRTRSMYLECSTESHLSNALNLMIIRRLQELLQMKMQKKYDFWKKGGVELDFKFPISINEFMKDSSDTFLISFQKSISGSFKN